MATLLITAAHACPPTHTMSSQPPPHPFSCRVVQVRGHWDAPRSSSKVEHSMNGTLDHARCTLITASRRRPAVMFNHRCHCAMLPRARALVQGLLQSDDFRYSCRIPEAATRSRRRVWCQSTPQEVNTATCMGHPCRSSTARHMSPSSTAAALTVCPCPSLPAKPCFVADSISIQPCEHLPGIVEEGEICALPVRVRSQGVILLRRL